jgi:hypothetical protein
MKQKTPYVVALSRALTTVGSINRLASALGVTEEYIQLWLIGAAVPPYSVFLDCVEIGGVAPVSVATGPSG